MFFFLSDSNNRSRSNRDEWQAYILYSVAIPTRFFLNVNVLYGKIYLYLDVTEANTFSFLFFPPEIEYHSHNRFLFVIYINIYIIFMNSK
jgi:hypothetical protein